MNKVLVAIAYHGTKNEHYVRRLIENYRNFKKYSVDIVLIIEKDKTTPEGAEVVIGAPTQNPWSLPFRHRELFNNKRLEYDYFIYSEDDTELMERHLDAFTEAQLILPPDRILGFLRHEQNKNGERFYSTIHHSYHFEPETVVHVDGETFVNYENQHSACYILSRAQLDHCIASGGFLVQPHEGAYDMLCSAATDPYTQCGLQRVLWASRPDVLSLHHMPDVYLGKIGVPEAEIHAQLAKIEGLEQVNTDKARLHDVPKKFGKTDFETIEFDKPYYEKERASIASLVPEQAKTILSILCERGQNESRIAKQGHLVSALCIDSIIAESTRALGITVVDEDSLTTRNFDCLILNNVLSYVEEPTTYLKSCLPWLSPGGSIIISFNNYSHPHYIKRWLERQPDLVNMYRSKGTNQTGFHRTSWRTVRSWLDGAGLTEVSSASEIRAPNSLKGIARNRFCQEALSISGSLRAVL